MSQTTSPRGRAALKLEEGDVLKAYRCPAGRWTIGVGLTKASGVVDPKPGMVITAKESDRLLTLALERNYEPAVNEAMPGAAQNAFDGGVSFHFNTGAIGRASWVKSWKVKDWVRVERGLKAWNKGGGKVLPGLVRRRHNEFTMIRRGLYPVPPVATPKGCARIIVSLGVDEMDNIRAGMRRLGYEPGKSERGILTSAVTAFQRDHDLTVDGVIGVATLSTLQRMLDARSKAAAPVAVTAASAGAEAVPGIQDYSRLLSEVPGTDWIIPALLTLSVVWLAWRAWQYRDAVAAKAQTHFPTLAAKLRSI